MSTDSSDGNGGPAAGAAPVRFVAAKRRNCTITQYCTYIAKSKPKLCDRRVFTGSASDFLKTVRSNGFFVTQRVSMEKTVRMHSPADHVRNCHRMQSHAEANGGVCSRVASSVTTEKHICRWLDPHLYVV
ncbi:hypothetical protein [Burkholderia ubonensis]|uniref:hypothetical protein n=1 Tax=Burkholderia ubonensis TaxID=101571 RepID=UPI001160C629|nr:hypothetical protein [Burkholderia ubonensis]